MSSGCQPDAKDEGVRQKHDVIFFVSGAKSSNGKVLFEMCKGVNPHTYLISGESELDLGLVKGAQSVGVCGATSTPLWLMEKVAEQIREIDND